MKQSIFTIFLIFYALQCFGQNISEFKIGGLSTGDSLLDFMAQDEIIESSKPVRWKTIWGPRIETDEFLDVVAIVEHLDYFSKIKNRYNTYVTIKNNDKNFLIQRIFLSEGYDSYDKCMIRFNKFEKKINYLFPKIKSRTYENFEVIHKSYIFKKWFKGDAEIYLTCQPGFFNIIVSSSELVSWQGDINMFEEEK